MEMPYTFIYTISLSKEEKQKLDKILSVNHNIELKHLDNLEDISKYLKKIAVNFVISNKSFNKKSNDYFIEENKGFFINVNLLILENENEELNKFEKYNVFFKTIQNFDSNSSLIEQATKLSDFINGNQNSSTNSIFLPLNIKLFKNMSTAPCDLHIKLSEKKFVKILSKDEKQHADEILEKYSKKDINEIYLESKNLNKVKDILTKLLFKIDETKDTKNEQKLQIAENVISVVKDFGVSEFLLEGINETFSELTKDMSKDKKLSALLAQINSNNTNVISNHSYLTAVFCSMIASKVTWNNATVRKNLCTAAILHDFEIAESQELMYEFKSIDEINQLPPKKRQLFAQHAVNAANMLAKNSNIPSDVINIIAKHHEGAGEKSYPQKLSSNSLTPPNCLFNVAHQFSIELAKVAFNQNKIELAFQRLREYYPSSSFKQFIDILERELQANS